MTEHCKIEIKIVDIQKLKLLSVFFLQDMLRCYRRGASISVILSPIFTNILELCYE